MTNVVGRSYAGATTSARVAKRRSRLLDVALSAMAENRWRSTTVAGLCAEAQLNKRYFYESFADLDQVADATIDEVAAEVGTAAINSYLATVGSSLEVQARAAVEAVVGVLGADRRKALVLLGGVPTTVDKEGKRSAAIAGLTMVLTEHSRHVHDVELERDSLAATGPAFVIGGTAQTILSWVNGDLEVSREQLIDDITGLWLLLGQGAADLARSRIDKDPR